MKIFYVSHDCWLYFKIILIFLGLISSKVGICHLTCLVNIICNWIIQKTSELLLWMHMQSLDIMTWCRTYCYLAIWLFQGYIINKKHLTWCLMSKLNWEFQKILIFSKGLWSWIAYRIEYSKNRIYLNKSVPYCVYVFLTLKSDYMNSPLDRRRWQ